VRPETSIEVPVRTLDSLLDDAKAPKPIDLLSIDVEGHELDVLRGFDFARWQPRLILLEDHVVQPRQAQLSPARRLSPDPAHRLERLVRAAGFGAVARLAGALADFPQILSRAAVSGHARFQAADARPHPAETRRRRMTQMHRLSAIVIAKNEAGNIGECLESLAFCDERIVVDSGSSDDTVRIAESRGAKVVQHAFEGFGAQKNFALSLAQGEWVLSLDADERVSRELADEIMQAIARPLPIATRCRACRVSADVPCGIPAGFPIMCCACSGAERHASPTTSCMSASSIAAQCEGSDNP
jgi:hypothetical protein